MAEIKQIQQRLLEMAVIIRDLLERNSIPYFITYGTLLGAVRHKGFIPWDDDFDFYLFDDSYDLALECLRKNLPNNLFLEYFDTEPLYFHDWAHVKDLYSKCDYSLYPQDGLYSHTGLSIDLYRIKKIRAIEEKLYRTQKHLEYLNRRKEKKLIDENEYKDRITGLLSEIDIQKKIVKENKEDSVYIYCPQIFYDDRLFEDELFPLKQYTFEGNLFYGPNNAEALLKRCYGDYMKLPPEDQRKFHGENVIIF